MLALENVSWTAADGEEILRNISLEVPDGKMTVITGPNGGGKTSLAKLIAGLVNPTEGKILLDGKDITDWDMTERARGGISYAFQQPVRFKGVTVFDLINLAAGKEISLSGACQYLSEVGLCAKDYINREVNSSLSGGEMKRIEIATVMARNTKLSVFDEPEAGIDLWSFQNLIHVFENLHKEKHGSILIISHQERILNTADEILVIAEGKLVKRGTRDEVLPGLLNAADAPEDTANCAIWKKGGLN